MPDFLQQKKEKDGMMYYILPKNYSLFRGDNEIDLSDGPYQFNNMPTFFSTNSAEVEQYGIVFEIVTTKEYKLLALDYPETIEKLYHNMENNEMKKILEKNYGYKTGIRDSVSKNDKKLSNYLCSQGYDGYATDQMKTDMNGKFHREIMLCHPESLLIQRQITSMTEVAAFKEESKLRKLGEDMKQSRKKRSYRYDRDDDDNDDNDFPKFPSFPSSSSRLFDSPTKGGKSRRRRIKKWQRKTNKRRTVSK